MEEDQPEPSHSQVFIHDKEVSSLEAIAVAG